MTEFYAMDTGVHAKPKETKDGVSMGFKVCEVDEFVGKPAKVAALIAKLLNEHYNK